MATSKNSSYSLRSKELQLWQKYEKIAGVDEAGRGALAGPVFAGAVILPPFSSLPLKDSKLLKPKERKEFFLLIKEEALDWSYGVSTVEEIEKLGILKAVLLAMKRAIESLKIKPDFVLVDGNQLIPKLEIPQEAIVKGDRFCKCISGASIVAKVLRDEFMEKLDKEYPFYGFRKHKGYPTKEHRKNIICYGPSEIHRKTFKLI
ncbi:MAG: ribonuclease HII [Dictyoglomus sp.]|nr:ribonuclease HII [Dictyoglomus sp.]MCX7941605.1 ribonuclease HII [Dictyoglomaceae bacterium]MDW8187776.1 ribonuclease HII [Dictyoglomus sp.]